MLEEQSALSPGEIARVDPKKMYEVYQSWPARAEESVAAKVDIKPRKYSRIVYLAVGGSATAGDIISDWFLSSGGPEVSVFRGYLPKIDLDDSLVVVCSTSGDTEETLRLARAVAERNPDMVTISTGGRLMELANSRGIPHVKIRMADSPRFTLPHSLFASIAVLKAASLIEGFEWELDEALANFKRVGTAIAAAVPSSQNVSKQLAADIVSCDPCIYAASVSRSIAIRFKNSLNENAKMHAHYDIAPDLFHNEVEAWELPEKRFNAVFLRRSKEPPFEARSLDVLSDMLRKKGVAVNRADGTGEGNLSQLVTTCYALDFASYYVGVLRKVDPYPIRLIDEFKASR